MMNKKNLRTYNAIITVVSVVIPIVVALLFTVRIPNVAPLDMLPPIYATINGLTAILLVVAVLQIKRGNRKLHERLMKVNIFLSLLFLVMYIAYHITSDSTPFGGEGLIRYVYFFILITHILLSIALIPLVLFTYKRAALRDFKAHKRLAIVTFPIWFYVAVTGVVVYLMIAPYYG
jgi:putative membrane protein